MVQCTVKNCNGKIRAKGLCQSHYTESRRSLPIERFYRGKSEAKRRNLSWKLTFKRYSKYLDKCYYCEKSIKTETGIGLDRILHTKGYSWDNVISCCGQCNQARNIFYGVNEFKAMITALKDYRKLYGRDKV